jgi:hypothetical protein
MNRRTLYFLAMVLVLTMGAVSCTPQPTDPSQINIDIHNDNTNNNGQGGPGASPSPGGPSTIARVGIGVFGEGNCDAGKVPAGAVRDNDVRVGCVANITCSPFDAQGNELFTGIPPSPSRFVAISGEGTVVRSSTPSNPYNLDVKGLAPGVAVFECEVGGVSSNAAANGPFRLTAVP